MPVPLARVFQCLFTFWLFFALCWLAEIWQLSWQGATGELEVEFKSQRCSCKLSFLCSALPPFYHFSPVKLYTTFFGLSVGYKLYRHQKKMLHLQQFVFHTCKILVWGFKTVVIMAKNKINWSEHKVIKNTSYLVGLIGCDFANFRCAWTTLQAAL